MLDETDIKILNLLMNNSRMQWQEIGEEVIAFITVFMKTTNHALFRRYIQDNPIITEANRISGEGCYMLKIIASNQPELVKLLDEILQYGNYKVNLSIENIK